MRALLPVGLVLACTIPNPLFDLEGTTATGLESTGVGEPTTTRPSTTSETGASTGGPVPTTGGTSTGANSGEVSGEASTAVTASSGDTTGDTTTGEPASCWPQQAAGWPVDGVPLTFADANPTDPFITPDGLGLWYIATEQRRPFLSTRASVADMFPNGVQQALWGGEASLLPAHPAAVLGGKELLFMSLDDVYSATATGALPNKYALPVMLTPPSTPAPEGKVTVTADSATMIVSRRDGPPVSADFPEAADRFYQYTRAQLEPGAGYAGGVPVTPMVGTLGLAICPTLSADGLHFFFASTESATLTKVNAPDVVDIYYTSRPDVTMPWGQAQALPIAHVAGQIACPSSVTADGCQLVYHRFALDSATYLMYLAVRSA